MCCFAPPFVCLSVHPHIHSTLFFRYCVSDTCLTVCVIFILGGWVGGGGVSLHFLFFVGEGGGWG